MITATLTTLSLQLKQVQVQQQQLTELLTASQQPEFPQSAPGSTRTLNPLINSLSFLNKTTKKASLASLANASVVSQHRDDLLNRSRARAVREQKAAALTHHKAGSRRRISVIGGGLTRQQSGKSAEPTSDPLLAKLRPARNRSINSDTAQRPPSGQDWARIRSAIPNLPAFKNDASASFNSNSSSKAVADPANALPASPSTSNLSPTLVPIIAGDNVDMASTIRALIAVQKMKRNYKQRKAKEAMSETFLGLTEKHEQQPAMQEDEEVEEDVVETADPPEPPPTSSKQFFLSIIHQHTYAYFAVSLFQFFLHLYNVAFILFWLAFYVPAGGYVSPSPAIGYKVATEVGSLVLAVTVLPRLGQVRRGEMRASERAIKRTSASEQAQANERSSEPADS